MSVNSTDAFSGPYTATGAAQSFPFSFNAASRDEVQVTADGIDVDPASYSVTLNSDGTGAVNATIAAGAEVFVESNPDFQQSAQFSRFAPYFPDAINVHLDRAAIRDIALRDLVSRTFVIPRRFQDAAGKFPTIDNEGNWQLVDGVPGIPGKAAAFRENLTVFKAAATADGQSTYDGSLWLWTPGNFSTAPAGQIDVNIVKADSTALTLGAWVRQDAGKVQFGEFPALQIDTVSDALKQGLNVDARRFGIDLGASLSAAQVTRNTQRLILGAKAIRGESQQAQSEIGSGASIITIWQSGGIVIPRGGTLPVETGAIKIDGDIGLSLVGEGSRGMTKSQRGASVLLFKGSGSAPGIELVGTGGRSFRARSLDICYDDGGYTGPLIFSNSAPDTLLYECFLGSYFLATAQQHRSAVGVQAVYDERLSVMRCVFDGLRVGVLKDQTIGTLGPFGGSVIKIKDSWFYDMAENAIKITGERTSYDLQITGNAFNPINIAPQRMVDINNVDAFTYSGNGHGTSTGTGAPTIEAVRFLNVTGSISDNSWDDLFNLGRVSGVVDFTGNRVATLDGLIFLAGVLRMGPNEWRKSATAIQLAGQDNTAVDISPQAFLSGVGTSIYAPTSTGLVRGEARYDLTQDLSSSKFENNSPNLQIRDAGHETIQTGASGTITRFLTGKTIRCTQNGGTQVQTLPKCSPGLTFKIQKVGSAILELRAMSGDNFLAGETFAPTVLTIPSDRVGAVITVESQGTTEWQVHDRSAGITAS